MNFGFIDFDDCMNYRIGGDDEFCIREMNKLKEILLVGWGFYWYTLAKQ